MAGAIDLTAMKDTLLVLGTAGVIVPLMHRLKISPVLGFLAAGAVLGPHGLGAFESGRRWLHWITIENRDEIAGIADFGVVFLLFVIGLELSLGRLAIMRRLVFGLGAFQVLLSALLIGVVATWTGLEPSAALVVGACLSLSSTAIVVEVLAEQKRLTSITGRATFAILLFQDLAVVPILFLVETLGHGGSEASVFAGLGLALLKGIGAIAAITVSGRLLLRPLFRIVADTDNVELFMAATLLVVIGTGVATAVAGLSMALGAFVAGLLLAETEYRRAIEATIEPFKGLLLGVFFFSVGMGVDIPAVLANPWPVFSGALVLLLIKGVVTGLGARVFGLAPSHAIKTALLIGPGGEFAFIVIGLAVGLKLVPPDVAATVLAIVSLTMAAVPILDRIGVRVGRGIEKLVPPDPETLVLPPENPGVRAIVVGHGRVGQLVSGMLDTHRVPHLVIERDPTTVTVGRRKGRPVYFGDATNPVFLKSCGIEEADAVIVSINAADVADTIVETVRAMRPDMVVVARARDDAHARRLYERGATDAVPETIEASLQLSEAALVGLGVPMGPVIASIHEKRDEFRKALKEITARSPHASAEAKRDGFRSRRAAAAPTAKVDKPAAAAAALAPASRAPAPEAPAAPELEAGSKR
ncbi:cation:proton antiporter [Methyloraptor flagellatus]|uniref:Cation:proton antiporter n=1 Tax=Methyloraptor flagellatus TaxID=3162530 RepID=A0AAU7XCZ7_9HYPH